MGGLEIYGATEFEAPGMHWSTPFRALGEQPTDTTSHAAIVEKAENWIDRHLPWLRAAAGTYGFYLHCDGAAILLVLPGEQSPPRMALHLIGALDAGAAPVLSTTEGPLQ